LFKKNQGKDIRALSGVIIAVVVVVIIVVAAVIGYLLWGGGGGDNNTTGDLKVGDYLKYEDVTTSGDSVLDYMYWLNVTAVTSTSYTIHMTTLFKMYGNWTSYQEHNWTVDKDAVFRLIVIVPTDSTDLGQMALDTAFGSRQVTHYQANDNGEVMDVYIGDNGVLYKYTYTLGGTHGEYDLVGTSLSWV